MSDSRFTAVDDYLNERVVGSDAALDATLESITREGLPQIQVSAPQAKFLALLVRMQGAKRVLEIGTLAGYSAIWMARELPAGGKLVTLEFEPHHAKVAQRNIERAGLGGCVEIRVGAALDSLAKLHDEKQPPFDFVFIDADKRNNPGYLDASIRLTRPGGVIVVDNVIREGKVIDPGSQDESVQGTRALFDALHDHERAGRLRSTAVQTVGSKGYDGFSISVVGGGTTSR